MNALHSAKACTHALSKVASTQRISMYCTEVQGNLLPAYAMHILQHNHAVHLALETLTPANCWIC